MPRISAPEKIDVPANLLDYEIERACLMFFDIEDEEIDIHSTKEEPEKDKTLSRLSPTSAKEEVVTAETTTKPPSSSPLSAAFAALSRHSLEQQHPGATASHFQQQPAGRFQGQTLDTAVNDMQYSNSRGSRSDLVSNASAFAVSFEALRGSSARFSPCGPVYASDSTPRPLSCGSRATPIRNRDAPLPSAIAGKGEATPSLYYSATPASMYYSATPGDRTPDHFREAVHQKQRADLLEMLVEELQRELERKEEEIQGLRQKVSEAAREETHSDQDRPLETCYERGETTQEENPDRVPSAHTLPDRNREDTRVKAETETADEVRQRPRFHPNSQEEDSLLQNSMSCSSDAISGGGPVPIKEGTQEAREVRAEGQETGTGEETGGEGERKTGPPAGRDSEDSEGEGEVWESDPHFPGVLRPPGHPAFTRTRSEVERGLDAWLEQFREGGAAVQAQSGRRSSWYDFFNFQDSL
uniref:Uncharacterized protein n=2 Tax=Chromera velia CCMP2878 TaxID=1169474 RepID=A0A0K6S7S5_9ALVE|eukprot:Cvel_22145.t1-p1 / transcript=Cvel_22145.t1 / gene=Cvel_22145 / organism=Chromera_velia_CCMP2878 / gene_product=hypothetical protein / transcript_product=hypothetical protein / location=Cvel_scaffold2148:7458-9793(-) / protein_length=470 / sequence_SO=supercontig / SO=protein_coding / is_pseudo=false